jgi:hypothetical protein
MPRKHLAQCLDLSLNRVTAAIIITIVIFLIIAIQ